MSTIHPFGLAPEEAIQWFAQKGYRLSFDWRDVWKEQHARAFTVAKATQLDVLAEIRDAVDRALRDGTTLADFRKQLRPTLEQKGWWGEKMMTDPVTGEDKLVQLGSARRLATIYETNLRTAQAAGRWDRLQRTKDRRPYARYVSLLDGNERPEHHAWHGTVLPIDHPWWDTHAPPNGWGCRCKMQQLSDRDLARFGYEITAPPPSPKRAWTNERTGETILVPKGIDPGFDYNPGKVPRGFTPPDNAPELEPATTFKTEGRPPLRELLGSSSLPEAPDRWHDIQDIPDAAARWNALFGGRDAAEITDPTGMQVQFSTAQLLYLMRKEPSRVSFIPRARATVEQPTEIWLVPHRLKDGRVVMRQRYIGIFKERTQAIVVVAQRAEDGHVFWTTYPASAAAVDKKRQGYLLYPSKEEP